MLRNQWMDAVCKWVWIQKIKILFPAHDLAGKKRGASWSCLPVWLSLVAPKSTATPAWIWVWSNTYGCLPASHYRTILCQQQQLFSHCPQYSTDPTKAKLQPVIKGSGAFSCNPICECRTAGNALYLINNKEGPLALDGGRSTPSLINLLHPKLNIIYIWLKLRFEMWQTGLVSRSMLI